MVLNRITDRRRRLLVDGTSPVANAGSSQPATAGKSKRKSGPLEFRPYTIGAERRHQPKTTDLIPKRRIAYAKMVAGVVLLLATLNLASIYAPSWESVLGREGTAVFKLWGAGTLTAWFSSSCFLVAAAVAWQILVLRRHRNDDYEGTYRVWGWLMIGCLVASAVCSVDLISPLTHAIGYLTSVSVVQPSWLPLAMMVAFFGLLATRVLFEVRKSYGTAAWTLFAWVAFSSGVILPELKQAWPVTWAAVDPDIAMGNGLLLAASASMLACFTYARFVFLRANGFIKERVVTESGTEQNQASSTSAPVDQDSSAPAKTRRKPKARKKSAQPATATEESAPAPDQIKAKGKAQRKTKAQPAKPQTKAKKQPAETAKTPAASPTATASTGTGGGKNVSSDASEKLKQLAAASRAKQAAQQQSSNPVAQEPDEGDDQPSTVKLSKSQRRKLRKQQRKMKRAA